MASLSLHENILSSFSDIEARLNGLHLTPREFLSVIWSVLMHFPDQSPEQSDIMRPVKQIQRAVALWVRGALRNHRHVLHHEIDEVVFGPNNPVRQPPEVQTFVHDTVCMSAQSLFWEGVRRVLLWSEQDIRTQGKVRCICECLRYYEERTRASHPIMSTYVMDLFDMSQDTLETVLAPCAEDICAVPWLRLELFEVMGLGRGHEVRERRAAAFNAEILRLLRQARPSGAYGTEAGRAPEGRAPEATVAPGIQALEGGDVSSAEGIVFQNYLRRGFELENERTEARDSFEAAVRQGF